MENYSERAQVTMADVARADGSIGSLRKWDKLYSNTDRGAGYIYPQRGTSCDRMMLIT